MEFLSTQDITDLLNEHGIHRLNDSEDVHHLVMDVHDSMVHYHIATREHPGEPVEGTDIIRVEEDRLSSILNAIIHRLPLDQVILLPRGTWRHVFDAVAFSLAGLEEWQHFDTSATVRLNTRDPLLCTPVDYHTMESLFKALLSDADSPEQGLMMTTPAVPLLLEIIPEGAIRISLGNAALADELVDIIGTG